MRHVLQVLAVNKRLHHGCPVARLMWPSILFSRTGWWSQNAKLRCLNSTLVALLDVGTCIILSTVRDSALHPFFSREIREGTTRGGLALLKGIRCGNKSFHCP